MLLTMHHIVSDGWSMGVLSRELAALYAAFRAGRPPPAGSARAIRRLRRLAAGLAAGRDTGRQLGYWRQQLAGAPSLELPPDRAAPRRARHAGPAADRRCPETLAGALKR